MNKLKNSKPKKRKVCYPKDFAEYEEKEDNDFKKIKKGRKGNK